MRSSPSLRCNMHQESRFWLYYGSIEALALLVRYLVVEVEDVGGVALVVDLPAPVIREHT